MDENKTADELIVLEFDKILHAFRVAYSNREVVSFIKPTEIIENKTTPTHRRLFLRCEMDIIVWKTKVGLETMNFSQRNFLLLSSCIYCTTVFSLPVTSDSRVVYNHTAQWKNTVFLGVALKGFFDRPNLSPYKI